VASHPIIRFEGDLVFKWYRRNVAEEFSKARSLWQVAQQAGFVFPEPIELDEGASVITYRNLHTNGDWDPIRASYLDYMTGSTRNQAAAQVIAEAGRVLGAIHRDLQLSDPEEWVPTPGMRRSLRQAGMVDELAWREGSQVFLHGDYGFSNVFWSRETGRIATLDPSPDGYSTFAVGLHGPPYVDLGQFVSCLEGRVPLQFYPRMRWIRLEELREVFLDAYEQESGMSIDRDCVRRFGFAIAAANFADRLPYTIGRRLAQGVLYNRFKGNAL
jgi:hypothetical protein